MWACLFPFPRFSVKSPCCRPVEALWNSVRVLTPQGALFSSLLPLASIRGHPGPQFACPLPLEPMVVLTRHCSLFVTVSSSFSLASLGASWAKTRRVQCTSVTFPYPRHVGGQHPGYVCG